MVESGLEEAISLAREAQLDGSIVRSSEQRLSRLSELMEERGRASRALEDVMEAASGAMRERSVAQLLEIAPRVGRAVEKARAARLNEEGPPSILAAGKLVEQMKAFAYLIEAHEPARAALAPFEILMNKKHNKLASAPIHQRLPPMMHLRNAGNEFAVSPAAASLALPLLNTYPAVSLLRGLCCVVPFFYYFIVSLRSYLYHSLALPLSLFHDLFFIAYVPLPLFHYLFFIPSALP
ncbi:MAG: hypothetical protein SGPRY_008105 [Prymnesium sp.]